MTPMGNAHPNWEIVGKAIEDLHGYERQIGYYEHATYDLLSAVVHGPDDSAWQRFLLEGENFAEVVGQVLSLSKDGAASPKAALDAIRGLIEGTCAQDPDGASSFLGPYLGHRPRIPEDVRDRLDILVKAGENTVPLRATALATEIERLRSKARLDGAADEVFRHWYEEVLRGRMTGEQAQAIPGQVWAARDRLLSELRQIERGPQVDEGNVYEKLSFVFTAADIPHVTEMVIRVYRLGLKIDLERLEAFLAPFLEHLSKEEAIRRLERLGQWMVQVDSQNNDGVILTPLLTSYLVRQPDFESGLRELDRLREETLSGRFRFDNPLQRDLEFKRFTSERFTHHGGTRGSEEHYAVFKELKELPPPREEEFVLSGQHLAEAKRAAYQAACFLQFLRSFRSKTDRQIVVVGNDRYGRQWVVEPLQSFLRDGFTLRYDRVRSHASFRLRVPHEVERRVREGFPQDFVREMNAHMPHIVIVDARNPLRGPNMMKYARGVRDYVNWFAVFNDIRAEGDSSKYERDSSVPHLAELRKWHEFAILRRQLKEYVLLGDFRAPRQDPDPTGGLPLVVIANADIYRTNGRELPEALHGTHPYYFDGPEKYVAEEIVFGFGDYGFETRVKGTTTDEFVAAVQRCMTAEIDRLLKSGAIPDDGVLERPG